MEPPGSSETSAAPTIEVVLEIDGRRFPPMSAGIHILYKNKVNHQISLQNKIMLKDCTSTLSAFSLTTSTFSDYTNINSQKTFAMFTISKSCVFITKMDTEENIYLESKCLIPFMPCELKHGINFQIGKLDCLMYIYETSSSTITNNVNAKSTSKDNISPPMKYASPVKISNVTNIEYALKDLLNSERKIESIHDVATQIEDFEDIHDVETQVETSPILKYKFNCRSVSKNKTRKFNQNLSYIDKSHDSEIISFDPLTENIEDNQESQNLLLDYDCTSMDICTNSKSTVKNQRCSNQKKKIVICSDDSSTDIDEFEIHTYLPKNVLSQNQNSNMLSTKETVDLKNPYVLLTQVDTNCKPDKKLHKPSNSIEKIPDKKLSNQTNLPFNDDLYDAPTQIMIPEKNNICSDINDLYDMPTQVLIPPIDLNKSKCSDVNDLYDLPTQVLIPSVNLNKTECSDVNDLYDLPTQVLIQQEIPIKTECSDLNDLYDASTQILTQEIIKKTVSNNRDNYRKEVLKTCLSQDLLNIGCDDDSKKNHYNHKDKNVQKVVEDNDPFYACTQDIFNDLKPSQSTESVAKKISPIKNFTFAIPKMQKSKKSSRTIDPHEKQDVAENIQKTIHDVNYYLCTQDIFNDLKPSQSLESVVKISPVKTKPEQNYYGCTQEIENDLHTQLDKSDSSKNKVALENNLNDVEISSSIDSISDSYLFPDEKEHKFRTPEKSKPFSILDIQLPATPDFKQSVVNTRVPDYLISSPSESENEDSDSPPIVFMSKIPSKPKIKRKESKSINKNDIKNKNINKEVKTEYKPNKTISTTSNNISDRRKRKCDESTKDLLEKRPKISDNLRSSSRIQNDNSNTKKKIMLTGISHSKYSDIVLKLGGENVQKDGDILVTGKISRTFKLIMAFSRAIPIVTTSWLTDSMRCSRFLDTKKYLVNDKKFEKKYSFKFENLSTRKFLKGWTIFITPSIEPIPTEMEEIIKCNGGVCSYQSSPSNVKNHDLKNAFTVSCSKDKNIYKNLPKPHLNVEVILIGVFTRILDFQKHRLNG